MRTITINEGTWDKLKASISQMEAKIRLLEVRLEGHINDTEEMAHRT